MKATSDVQRIRADPLTWLPTIDHLVLEIVALGCLESANGPHPISIRVLLLGGATARIADTGRGTRFEPDPDEVVGHAEMAMTSLFPVAAPDRALMEALEEEVWGARGSQGPVVANALCESLCYESSRGGQTWAQRFRRGVPVGPPEWIGRAKGTGTRTTLTADPSVFGDGAFDRAALQEVLERLTARVPLLDVALVP